MRHWLRDFHIALGASLLSLVACGGPADPADAGGSDAGSSTCSAPDDPSCAVGTVCVSGACVASTCGDDIVDSRSGEDCEDGNTTAFDGCTGCAFDCSDAATCDDGDPCSGVESCDPSTHVCVAGTAATDGADCSTDSIASGFCRTIEGQARCVSASCGNGFVDDGERCDDGADGDPDDGCRDDCTFSCEADADCGDGDACNGDETCDGDHRCAAGTPVPMLTWWTDCDADGVAPSGAVTQSACGEPSSAATGCDGRWTTQNPAVRADCDDSRPEVHGGADEICDGIDNDCSSGGGDDASEDSDGDGFAPVTATCTGGPFPKTDCDDANAAVPTTEVCNRGVDDDCDGMIDEDCGCTWRDVSSCNTGASIAAFCGTDHVGRLGRCDGSTFGADDSYLSTYLLSMCSGMGCSPSGVVFRRVECCTSPTVAPPP